VIPTEPKEHAGRMKLLAHLRREITVLEPEADEKEQAFYTP